MPIDEAMRQQVLTQELGFGDYLRISVRYFLWEMILILALTLAINFPINLLGECLNSDPKNVGYYLMLALVYATTSTLIFFCTPLLVIWAASVVRQKIETGTASWVEACNEAAEKFGSILWILVLQTFVVGGLMVFLFVPGLICLVFLTFSIPIAAITTLRGPEAMDYSIQLVKGRWWKTFWNLFFYNMLSLILVVIIASVTVVLPMIVWPESSVVSAFANTLVQVIGPMNLLVGIMAPLVMVPTTVWFLNWHWLANRGSMQSAQSSLNINE